MVGSKEQTGRFNNRLSPTTDLRTATCTTRDLDFEADGQASNTACMVAFKVDGIQSRSKVYIVRSGYRRVTEKTESHHAFFLVAAVPFFWDMVMATRMPTPTSATGTMLAIERRRRQ